MIKGQAAVETVKANVAGLTMSLHEEARPAQLGLGSSLKIYVT